MAPSTTATRRPRNTTICVVLALLSALGLWTMRISTAMEGVPIGFVEMIESGVMPNGVKLRKHYTGLGPLDDMLSFLVGAFLPGPTGWNENFYWQQLHFLVQIMPLIAVTTVEACRERNQGSWLKYTTMWSLVYQNVGGAVILSIWWIVLHRHSSEKSYFTRGRSVKYAALITPSIVLLYLLPTLAIFAPNLGLDNLQSVLAFWQLSPIYVNIPLWFASVLSSKSTSTTTKTSDMPHLKFLYIFNLIVSVAVHWYTAVGITSSADRSIGFGSVFIPSTYRWKNSYGDGLLWIFQWDWIIIGFGNVIACIAAVCDVQRMVHGAMSFEQFCEGGIVIVALTWIAGPGAALSAVWLWREIRLAEVEEKTGGLKKKL